MKTKKSILKKSLSAIVVMCAMVLSTNVFGQNYQIILWDDYTANSNVPYCSCDFIKCVPPEGVTNITWFASGVLESYIGDTLVLASGFDNRVDCFYDGGGKYLNLRPLAPPTSPLFSTNTTVCTLETTLDAGNYSQYGFNSYTWNTTPTEHGQTVNVGAGNYTVNIHNICGDAQATTTVIYDNPNRPQLGPDREVCANGEQVILDPNVANADTTKWYPGNISSPTLAVTYSSTYSCYVVDVNGCNGRDTIQVILVPTYDIEMQDVSFDPQTQKNMVRWCVNPEQEEVTSIIAQVQSNVGTWVDIGNVLYNTGFIIHEESNPQEEPYNRSYRIKTVSACGEGDPSSPHTSIFLRWYSPTALNWDNYQGGGFIPTYYIIYAMMNDNSIDSIGSRPPVTSGSNDYTITPNPDVLKYFIAFHHPCGGSKGTKEQEGELVMSNYLSPFPVGIASVSLAEFTIYPNPATDHLTITIDSDIFQVDVLTMLGQVLLTEHNVKTLDVSTLPQGIYTISVSADGVTTNKRFIKQ